MPLFGKSKEGAVRMIPPKSGSFIVTGGKAYQAVRGQAVEVIPQDVEALTAQGWVSETAQKAAELVQRQAQVQAQRYTGEMPAAAIHTTEAMDRVLPPSGGRNRSIKLSALHGGRAYEAGDGQPQDVPHTDVRALTENGWVWLGCLGSAADRPRYPLLGDRRFEGEPGCNFAARRELIYDGIHWRCVFTGEVISATATPHVLNAGFGLEESTK